MRRGFPEIARQCQKDRTIHDSQREQQNCHCHKYQQRNSENERETQVSADHQGTIAQRLGDFHFFLLKQKRRRKKLEHKPTQRNRDVKPLQKGPLVDVDSVADEVIIDHQKRHYNQVDRAPTPAYTPRRLEGIPEVAQIGFFVMNDAVGVSMQGNRGRRTWYDQQVSENPERIHCQHGPQVLPDLPEGTAIDGGNLFYHRLILFTP